MSNYLNQEPINTFQLSKTALPYLFVGRDEYINNILSHLSSVKQGSTPSFLLYGEKGIGKTSLASFIQSKCLSNQDDQSKLNFATSYYAAEKNQTLVPILEASLNNLIASLPLASLSQLKPRLRDLFVDGRFTFQIKPASSSSGLEAKQYVPTHDITNCLAYVIKSLVLTDSQYRRDGLFIIIDDIHNLEDVKGLAHTFKSIIGTLDFTNLGYISFLLISPETTVNTFFAGDPSPRRNFNFIKLTALTDKEAQALLSKGLVAANKTFDQVALIKGIRVAAGHPQTLQRLGHQLLKLDVDNYIGKDDWQQVIGKLAQKLRYK